MGSCLSRRRDRGLLEDTEGAEIALGSNKLIMGQPVWEGKRNQGVTGGEEAGVLGDGARLRGSGGDLVSSEDRC